MLVFLIISSKHQGINARRMEEIVFVPEGFIVKQIQNFENENAEAICLALVTAEKKWCIFFAYRAPHANKTVFDETNFTWNKVLVKHDNILPAGDWNIDELSLARICRITCLRRKVSLTLQTSFKSPNETLWVNVDK